MDQTYCGLVFESHDTIILSSLGDLVTFASNLNTGE